MGSEIKRRSNDAFFKTPRNFDRPLGKPLGSKWKKERAAGNKELNKLQIHFCEAPVDDLIRKNVCRKRYMLTWSHPVKPRFLVTPEDWKKAARQCLPCHQYCETQMTAKERKDFINAAIARRNI